jgi:chromosome segregation ATPase
MDERTKSILAIEKKKADESSRIDGCLRGLGRLLLEGPEDSRIAVEQSAYGRINDETARLAEAVRRIDRDVERINEIDNTIADEERVNSEVRGRLTAIYPNVGRLVAEAAATVEAATSVEDGRFTPFFAPYKTEIDVIRQKMDSLNERLAEMDEKDPPNILMRLGQSVRHLAIKSQLAKTEASRKQLYAKMGAEFAYNRLTDGQAVTGELEELCTSASLLKSEYDERDMRVFALKEEKRAIRSTFGREGNENRKRTEIRRQTEQLNRDLNDLYLRLGRKAEDLAARHMFQSLFNDETERILQDIARYREIVRDYEDQTDKLKVSLEIDEERADVEKLTKSIAVQRQRIAAAEEIIARHNKRIADATKRIAGLMQGNPRPNTKAL